MVIAIFATNGPMTDGGSGNMTLKILRGLTGSHKATKERCVITAVRITQWPMAARPFSMPAGYRATNMNAGGRLRLLRIDPHFQHEEVAGSKTRFGSGLARRGCFNIRSLPSAW